MKYIIGIGLAWFCLSFMIKNTSKTIEEAPVLEIDQESKRCICFEWYFNKLDKADRTIYQSCDNTILDYNEDDITLASFTLHCDSLIDGIKIKSEILFSPQYYVPEELLEDQQ